jgi:hypothetical protein
MKVLNLSHIYLIVNPFNFMYGVINNRIIELMNHQELNINVKNFERVLKIVNN